MSIQKGRNWGRLYLHGILFISFLIRVIYVGLQMPAWWDTHIYIGMGKYMFSGGQVGIWELFRPLVHPFLLGMAWFLGLDPLIVGAILDIVFSLLAIWLVFLIACEVWGERVGLVSCALFSFTGLFLMFSGLVLTEPLGLVFMLCGVWLFFRKKWIYSGVVLGLAFLTKFPLALVLVALGVALLLEKRGKQDRESSMVRLYNLGYMGLGFTMVSLPYFIFNYVQYGNPVLPLLEGSTIVTTYTWLYGEGWSYYLHEFFFTNWIYLLIIPFGYYFVSRKLYRDVKIRSLMLSFMIFFVYFQYVPRKEVRYLVLGLPFLAIMVAVVMVQWYDYLKRSPKPLIKPGAFVFLCVVIVVVSLPQSVYFERPPSFATQITELVDTYNLKGLVLTTDPAPVSFLENRIATLNGILYAPAIYEQHKQDYELLYVNTCDLSCPVEDVGCFVTYQHLISTMQAENFPKIAKMFKNCTYYLFVPQRIVGNNRSSEIEKGE